MQDDRLSALCIMNIETKVLNMIEFDDIMNVFFILLNSKFDPYILYVKTLI